MAESREEPKVVTRFMPSLIHCTVVKVAIWLFEAFDVETMEEAYTEIQCGNTTTTEECDSESCIAREILLEIPADVRKRVMQAVHSSHKEFQTWLWYHNKFKIEKRDVHWRFDGSLDLVKTARDVVQNAKFDIGDRFELACNHFFEDSVKSLWAEMEASDQPAENRTWPDGVVSFWIQWLREQPRTSWVESLVAWMPKLIRDLDVSLSIPPVLFPRCSAFHPLLKPEDRENSLNPLHPCALFDDIRFFLYGLTKHEEERLIQDKSNIVAFLRLHLQWPLQTLFLETAGKLRNFLDKDNFSPLLHYIFAEMKRDNKDFNYSDLFEKFWDASPPHLRKVAKKCTILRYRIDKHFYLKELKRKSVEDEESEKNVEQKNYV